MSSQKNTLDHEMVVESRSSAHLDPLGLEDKMLEDVIYDLIAKKKTTISYDSFSFA